MTTLELHVEEGFVERAKRLAKAHDLTLEELFSAGLDRLEWSPKPMGKVSPSRLDALTGIVALGGDALQESESLYEPDWD